MDLDDTFEAVIDVEDVAEEIFEPDELLEDLAEDPLEIVFALVAAGAALFTLVAGAVLLLVLAFRVGLVLLVAGLVVLGLLATLLAIGAFLYVRRAVPRRVERRIERAREQADGSRTEHGGDARNEDATMTEEEAIDHLREQYAEREITIHELEDGLEEIMRSDDPGEVVREYERNPEREYGRE